MCGRFTQAVPWSAVWAFSQPLVLAVPDEPLQPRYNIAPTQSAWVIAGDGRGGAKVGTMRWGLIPHWTKELKAGLATFNARIESAATKPTFRQSFERRHCLVPASGYYEWVGEGKDKQPWYIHPVDAPLMLFAGLWDRWVSPEGEALLSFTVLTDAADGELTTLHDRRPVMLQPEQAATWLDAARWRDEPRDFGEPPALEWHPVGREVNNARNDYDELIRPASPDTATGATDANDPQRQLP